ncbi:MAG: hypothetical protein MZV63_07055 [Marinilabiliales bacterium]|nr:hypothetical protein [Marinilabiliales bacterium]
MDDLVHDRQMEFRIEDAPRPARTQRARQSDPVPGSRSMERDPTFWPPVDRHYKLMQEVAYFNVMGPLLMGMYNNMLKAPARQRGVEFSYFDLTEGMTEIAEYDPPPT